MNSRRFRWTLPIGLVVGGLIGFGVGVLVGETTLWMILGAGGGLVLGLAISAVQWEQR